MTNQFDLTDDQREIQELARRFTADRITPFAAEWDEKHHYPVDVWKAAAPSIAMLSPDIYNRDSRTYEGHLDRYARPDNALFVAETGNDPVYARYVFDTLGRQGIGFSPFGMGRPTVSLMKMTVRRGITFGSTATVRMAATLQPSESNARMPLAPA